MPSRKTRKRQTRVPVPRVDRRQASRRQMPCRSRFPPSTHSSFVRFFARAVARALVQIVRAAFARQTAGNRLAQCAPFIRQAHNPCLATRRWHRHQRKHMARDNIPLARRQLKIFLRTRQGKKRVAKSMQSMARVGVVPVIEKVIVQQGPAQQREAVDGNTDAAQALGKGQTCPRYRGHMRIHRHIAIVG